jgi:hypothetical protein
MYMSKSAILGVLCLVSIRFTGYVGRKASEGLRKLGKQQLYYKDLNLSLSLERHL